MSYQSTKGAKSPFGLRDGIHTITITKGDKSRRFTVRPAYVAASIGALSLLAVGYLGATAYLVMRDDLIGSSLVQQAQIKSKYEARIMALRSRIDLITSQQMVKQQAVETKVKKLLEWQTKIGSRSRIIGTVLQKATATGTGITVPTLRPKNAKTSAIQPAKTLQLGSLSGTSSPFTASVFEGNAPRPAVSLVSLASLSEDDDSFSGVEISLQNAETEQISTIRSLRADAVKKTRKIAGILKNIGISIPFETQENIGGPLIELSDPREFETQVTALDEALSNLNIARKTISKLPIGSPVPGRTVSSKFGRRVDPLVKRAAMHSGLDFRAPMGFPVKTTGDGKVVKAGRQGGYGLMVEVVHGNGLITRYAHMSRVLVKVGQRIKAGTLVGKVGSTGRSTGPHLHYEVRSRGKVQNPTRYVRTGAKLRSLL